MPDPRDRRLMAHGFLLFTLALVVGSFSQWLPNPRMGLATHLEGVMNGMLLVLLGLIWQRLILPPRAKSALYWLPIIGAYTTLVMHLFAAVFPSGNDFMPIAAQGRTGAHWQEIVVTIGVIIIGVTLLPSAILAAWGLWRPERE